VPAAPRNVIFRVTLPPGVRASGGSPVHVIPAATLAEP